MKTIISILTITIALSSCKEVKPSKIGFIKTGELVFKFKGMTEAHNEYKRQALNFEKEQDSLKRKIEELKTEYFSLSSEMQSKSLDRFMNLSNEINSRIEEIQNTLVKLDEQLTTGVLRQVEVAVEEYAKDNNFDLIHGVNNGSILYGNDELNLTEEILKKMNNEFVN